MSRQDRPGIRELAHEMSDALRRAKAGYDAEDRFGKLRVWIIGAFGLDVLLTVAFVFFVGGRALAVDAWYEEGFPSNLIIIQNEGAPLEDVELRVDGKFTARVRHLEPGPSGLELDREFRDGNDFPPPASYRPRALEIRAGRSTMRIELRKAEKK